MTQCKEIAKKLKKMLSIYSIEEKEAELLPEFTEPFRFRETLFQQCRNAADELSYLGSCLSCESGDFPICSMEFIRETAWILHRVQL